jgi:hypothetical protein
MSIVTKPIVAARSFPSQGVILDVEQRPVDASGWTWRLNAANAQILRWDTLEVTSPAIFEAIVRFIRAIVESSSPTHAFNTFHGMKMLARSETFRRVHADDDVLPLAILTEILQQGASDSWRLHYVRQLYYWGSDWGHPNFSPEVAFEAKQLRIPKNPNGIAVRSADPTDGPLTDLELTALVNALTAAESDDTLTVAEIAALWLSISFGPNPMQMSLLREENFIAFQNEQGKPAFFHLDVPRMKKPGMSLRGAFRRRPLSVETGMAIQRLIDHNATVRRDWPEDVAQDILPLFPADRPRRLLLDGPMHEYAMHMASDDFSKMIASAVEKLGVISHRTGETLRVFSPAALYVRYALGARGGVEAGSRGFAGS